MAQRYSLGGRQSYMEKDDRGNYVAYNEKRDTAYSLLLAYAEFDDDKTGIPRACEILAETGCKTKYMLRQRALAAAKAAEE